jgi:hypothetical protein
MSKVHEIIEFVSTSQYPYMDDSREFLPKSDEWQSYAHELDSGRLLHAVGA